MANRKSPQEAKAERTTWFFLVLVFIALNFDREGDIAGFAVPIICAFILLFSAIYQQLQRRWRVAPIVWIIATGLLILGGTIWYFQTVAANNAAAQAILLYLNPVLISLVATVIVILMGVLTNEG